MLASPITKARASRRSSCRRTQARFDGGVLTTREADAVRITDPEIADWRFFEVDAVRAEMRDQIWRRLRSAVDSLADGILRYVEREP